ncbi:MAG: fused MFS/spermidine synthase [Pirellulaceae bacterium]
METNVSNPRGATILGERSAGLAWWSAATILVSAFLLFQVQPVISKTILPWFGGSPAVWTTALLFFQVVLLAGYAYAHVLIRYVPLARQALVHVGLLLLALATLPITPGDYWKPADGNYPALRILALLLLKVGPTYFLLSATGPLVQAWFSQAYPGRSPYRLYALSNIGSLVALLSYPFLFEIMLPVNTQGQLWSLGFVIFAGLISVMALGVWKMADDEVKKTAAVNELPESFRTAFADQSAAASAPPSVLMRIGWILLAALGTTSLMAITNHVCQDISVDPFMWVVPLSLYLLSLIICFDSDWWYIRKLWGPLAILGILALSAVNNGESVRLELQELADPETFVDEPGETNEAPWRNAIGRQFVPAAKAAEWVWDRLVPVELTIWYSDNLVAQAIAYVAVLFLICMVCHGELAKSKPQPRHLTMFFLTISAGGALGGLFVAVVCPLVFTTYFELPLCIVLGFLLGWLAFANDGRDSWLKGRDLLQWTAAFVVVGTTLIVGRSHYETLDEGTIARRNFYGILSVKKVDQDDPAIAGRQLYHGRILHGMQFREPIEVGEEVLFQPPEASATQTFVATEIKEGRVTLRGSDGREYRRSLGDWSLELAQPQNHPRELEPNTYYVASSGVGVAAEHYPRLPGQGMRVAVIGLGTGTMVSHGKQGDFYRFYEIDPKVVAMSDKYFTYRAKSPADNEVVLGDARIQMERQADQNYDLIVLDAFTGDAIPAHLLTQEAFVQYLRHLRKDAQGNSLGIVAVHISNRYLNLEPIVAALARKFELPAKVFHVDEGDHGNDNGDTGSDWILVTRNEEFWNDPAVKQLAEPLSVEPEEELLWTDQRSSLFPILE